MKFLGKVKGTNYKSEVMYTSCTVTLHSADM